MKVWVYASSQDETFVVGPKQSESIVLLTPQQLPAWNSNEQDKDVLSRRTMGIVNLSAVAELDNHVSAHVSFWLPV